MNITIVFLSYKFIYSQANINILKMTKAEIVNKISSNLGLEKNEVLATVENFMDEVKNSLSEGENVYLRGFGSFIVKRRARNYNWICISFKKVFLHFLNSLSFSLKVLFHDLDL